MFGDLNSGLKKVSKLNSKLEKAKKENKTWKVKQIEAKIQQLNRKQFAKLVWDSKEKGTYRKGDNDARTSGN